MGTHGKLGSLTRKARQKGAQETIQQLSQKIQAVALKDGSILCRLTDVKFGTIDFRVEQTVVLTAAEAGMKFAKEIKKHYQNGAGATEIVERSREAAALPAGGEQC